MQTRNKGQSSAFVTERDASLCGAHLLLLNYCPGSSSSVHILPQKNCALTEDEISAMFLLPNTTALIPTLGSECYSKHQAGITQVAS
ncbi:hypothetical protein AVEN_96861-1 [Araneus ventricosus]|uniref:Uncharacterized protein n=1 Tax=Araneus ventricosus TaxID=182803 RepID=A0A4Y2VXF5_ARAVE|nr:hypothetical protein AVEN_96861-1 [Araneus ventricosus]